MTREEAVALLERYSNYEGLGIPNLAGCKEAMKVAAEALKEAYPELAESEDEKIRKALIEVFKKKLERGFEWVEYGIPNRSVLDWLEKQKEQKPAEWSEEDEKLFWGLTAYVPNEELERLGVTRNDILKKLKSIRHHPIQIKEAYKEGFQTARHATALAFMNYCDKIRPNGKMCLSNGECEEIEKAFLVGDWDKIERYFHKCHWKPSEEQMKALNEIVNILAASPFLHQNDYLFNILNGLREELKKLL